MKPRIAFTSMACIVVAMGLGRFALTPQLPHMISEGLTLTQASWLAAANFLGYLVGAIETINARRGLIFRLKAGLWGSGILLILSALIPADAAAMGMNVLLRFLAGVASAWVLVLLSTWVQHELGKDHALRSVTFSGVGVGIVLTGIIAIGLDYKHAHAALGWLIFGGAALFISFCVSKNLPGSLPEASKDVSLHMTGNSYRLLFSYVLCGLGYILPATFLSKLAIDRFPGSLIADAFWPLFGFAVIAGMALLATQGQIKSSKNLLAGIFCMQSIGILACTLLHGMAGLVIGALLVGGSFMPILQLTMQLGAELSPQHVRVMTGILTTGFAIGQLIGPLLSGLSTYLWSSLTPALFVAAIGSFVAALLVCFISGV